MPLRIVDSDPNSASASDLLRELSADLGARYDDDGSGAFRPEDLLTDRAAFVIAWLDEVPIGCGALRPMTDETTAEIKRMYVRESARGRGIARQILVALEQRARDFGYVRICLETGTRQPEAIRLYESSDYVRIACYGQYAHDPLSVCYGKSLSD